MAVEQLFPILMEASVRATLLAALVAGLLLLLRIPSGAPRHTAWLVVVVAMIAMPLLQQVSPALPMLPARVPDMTQLVMLPPSDPIPQPVSAAPLTLAAESTPVADARASTPIAAQIPASPIHWVTLALIAYSVVAVGLLLRLLLGLYGVRTIARGARPIGGDVYESPALATPVTVGLIRPRVMVPPGWPEWPASTREAVLAHERAHARRRDPLVALIAGVNRCAFWFHPLAWWLERNLADAAEDACDAAALQTTEQPQYAEVLIAMAAASQRAGGRLARAGVHVSGGRLSRRIDRILRGHPNAASPARRAFATAGCVLSVAIVVACKSQQSEVPPLGPPEVPQRVVEQRREDERYEAVRAAAHAMTADEAERLEREWRRKPDLAGAEKLLFFYEPVPGRLIPHSGGRMPEDPKRIAGRRPIVLWLIEHHPDSDLFERRPGRITSRRDWLPDSQGYDAAKRLWLAHAARPDVTAKTLRTAASFLAEDRLVAEQLLLQGQRMYPNQAWSRELGRRYATAIYNSSWPPLSAEDARAYASKVRSTLDATRDPLLLATAGQALMTNTFRPGLETERMGLARTYLERAIQLDPKSQEARAGLDLLDDYAFVEREATLLAGVPPESKRDVIAKLPEPDRLVLLVRQATREHLETRNDDWRSFRWTALNLPERVDEERAAAASHERARQYANEALELAMRRPDDRDSADAVFAATMALGANAFREGNRRAAIRHMLDAADAPASFSRRTGSMVLGLSLERRLIGGLLQAGERETVIDYFERSARRRPADRERLLAAATAIRNGKQPINYQRR